MATLDTPLLAANSFSLVFDSIQLSVNPTRVMRIGNMWFPLFVSIVKNFSLCRGYTSSSRVRLGKPSISLNKQEIGTVHSRHRGQPKLQSLPQSEESSPKEKALRNEKSRKVSGNASQNKISTSTEEKSTATKPPAPRGRLLSRIKNKNSDQISRSKEEISKKKQIPYSRLPSSSSSSSSANPLSVKEMKVSSSSSQVKSKNMDEDSLAEVKNRPFTLPPGVFRPKQSLGQNFLSDQNYVEKIVNALSDDSEQGCRVVEIGPGAGALTRVLHPKYPLMTAIEIDQRAVAFLSSKLPSLACRHIDVLMVDWGELALEKGGRLNILGNLPYYITSQVLFSLADHHNAIRTAVVTMQLEVAERITAKPKTKDYGIPSVVFQLYGKPVMNFRIPPSVFFPQPKVDSALLTIDFTSPHPRLHLIKKDALRKILTYSFQQRRKMLRVSLKELIKAEGLELQEKWATRRPEELTPSEFIDLTLELYGEKKKEKGGEKEDVEFQTEAPVWRVKINKQEAEIMGNLDDDDLSSL